MAWVPASRIWIQLSPWARITTLALSFWAPNTRPSPGTAEAAGTLGSTGSGLAGGAASRAVAEGGLGSTAAGSGGGAARLGSATGDGEDRLADWLGGAVSDEPGAPMVAAGSLVAAAG